METTQRQCETFFNFLRCHYRLKRTPSLHCHEVDAIWWEKEKVFVHGYATCIRDKVEIHIARHRGIVEVFKTIAHEYKHCLQRYNELTWIGVGLLPRSSPLENEADAFAEAAFAAFIAKHSPPAEQPAAPVVPSRR